MNIVSYVLGMNFCSFILNDFLLVGLTFAVICNVIYCIQTNEILVNLRFYIEWKCNLKTYLSMIYIVATRIPTVDRDFIQKKKNRNRKISPNPLK